MFDIGFSEILLVLVIGLVVLGPERLPVVIKTAMGWIRALRSLAANVQNELIQEMKLQELQDGIKKVEQASKAGMNSDELTASVEKLKYAGESLKSRYLGEPEKGKQINANDISGSTEPGIPIADVTLKDGDYQAVSDRQDNAVKMKTAPGDVSQKESVSSDNIPSSSTIDER